MKRRDLLKACGGTLMVSSLGLGTASGALAATGKEKRLSTFQELVNQRFWLNHPVHRAVPLTLEKVDVPATKFASPHIEQFTLKFRGAARLQISEGTYEVDHPVLGRFLMHIVPAGLSGAFASYRSDFNLLV